MQIADWEQIPIEQRNIALDARSAIPVRVLLDIADFYAVASIAAQRLNIFWVESVAIPRGRGV
jgi:hypothetical protein